MATPFSIQTLERMYDAIRRDTPRFDTAHISPREFDNLRKNEVQYAAADMAIQTLYGMRLRVNSMFPYNSTCPECHGTGEGKASTYCPKCKGAGAQRVEGMMTGNDDICLITSPLPKKFEPRWPADVLVPKRPIR